MDPAIVDKIIDAYTHALSLRYRSLEPAQYDILRDLLMQWNWNESCQ